MSNVLKPSQREQVIALGRLGWSLRRIQRETGIRRETAAKYLKEAHVPLRKPGGWGHGRPEPPKAAKERLTDPESKPAIEGITDSESKPAIGRIIGGERRHAVCEAHRELIECRLGEGCTVMSIFQELVEHHGYSQRYSSVRRFARKLDGGSKRAFAVIQTPPGEEGQVDYGDGPFVRHPQTGRYRRTRMFVLTLGHSRKAVRFLTWKSSSEIWCELHEKSFRRLGGSPLTIVLDNLKEGVLKPDIYDPELNPLYRDVLKHYGVVGMPCRVRDPNRKGKVESSVAHAQKAFRGRKFEDIESAQAFLDRWEARWADTRIHGTTKRQVNQAFEEERPHLQPLPLNPFRYYRRLSRKVQMNGCVEVEHAFYSVPPSWLGQSVEVQVDQVEVRVLCPHSGSLLRQHAKQRAGGYRIKPEDKPERTPPQVESLLARSHNLGEHVGKLCAHIYAHEGQTGVRRLQGLMSLAKKHGKESLDDSCRAAFECGAPTYRFVKNYLQRLSGQPRQRDPLIRELGEYRRLIERITEGEVQA